MKKLKQYAAAILTAIIFVLLFSIFGVFVLSNPDVIEQYTSKTVGFGEFDMGGER